MLDAADAVAEPERPAVIADLAAGSAPYLLRALAAQPRVARRSLATSTRARSRRPRRPRASSASTTG